METKFLVEKTALKELNSKFDLGIDLNYSPLNDVLFSMYHFGYDLISEKIKEEYKEALNSLTKEQWLFYLQDLNALMTQLTKNNYKVLLSDIKMN